GGTTLLDGTPNPSPRRSYPWGDGPASLATISPQGVTGVGATTRDKSPYGVLNMAGNVMEWTDSLSPSGAAGVRLVLGGNWTDARANDLVDYMTIVNPRAVTFQWLGLGVRCAISK